MSEFSPTGGNEGYGACEDEVASYFGSFDLINQSELDRLCQEYEQASQRRKEIEQQYEEPVDMDSWGMNLIEESAWLKNSATENLDGIWKAGADIAIDVGQGLALSPLLLGGAKTYIAGVAANAAAEDMFEQTAEGKSASKALGSGVLTAGVEVATDKILDIENTAWKDAEGKIAAEIKRIRKAGEFVTPQKIGEMIKSNPGLEENLRKGIQFEGGRESALYLMDYLADKIGRDPEAELNLSGFGQEVAANKSSKVVEKVGKSIAKEIERFWDTLE